MTAPGPSLATVLLAAAVVVALAQLGALAAVRLRQPAVIGEMVAVVVAGPGVLGTLLPGASALLYPPGVVDVFRVLGGLGVVLFVFTVASDVPYELIRRAGRTAVVVGTSAFALPAACGAGLAAVLAVTAPWLGTASPAAILFLGLATGMTALPVLARILQDVPGLGARDRMLALATAACADAFGWAGLVLLLAGRPDTGLIRLGATVLGVLAVVLAGRLLLRRLAAWAGTRPVAAFAEAGAILAVLLASAALSELGGLHSVVGALAAGVALPRTERLAALTPVLETVACVLLLPMFYVGVSAGLRLGGLGDPLVLLLLVTVPLLAVASKVVAAWAPARRLGLSHREGLVLGAAASCRGLTEIVVLVVGLGAGLISPTLFGVFVVMSLVTTVLTGPALRRLAQPAPAPAAPSRRGRGAFQRGARR
jgi:Kef-type K+ transport system membrane component KefB